MSVIFAAAAAAGGKNQTVAMYVLIAVAVIALAVPVVVFWLIGRMRAKGKAAEGWPVADGVLTEARISEHRVRRKGVTTVTYKPEVKYTYQAGGAPYTGTRLRFGWLGFRDLAKAQTALAGFTQGAQVQVRYDPAKPSDSTLTTAVDVGNMRLLAWAFVALDVVFGGIAAAALIK